MASSSSSLSSSRALCVAVALLALLCLASAWTGGHASTASVMRTRTMRMMGGFGSPSTAPPSRKQSKSKADKLAKAEAEATASTPGAGAGAAGKTLPIKRSGDGQSVYEHCPEFDIKYDGLRVANSDPPVFEIDNFFTAAQCEDYLQRHEAVGYRIPSQTYSSLTSSKRTSTTWFLKYEDAAELILKAHRLTGIPVEHFEEPQVVRYETGQQFSWHMDSIPKSMQSPSGNRLATILVYLNDVNLGGCTTFKDLNIQVKPELGKALVFFPSFKDGRPDDRTTHAGQVAMDSKWIAQMWVHERPYSPQYPEGTSHANGVAAMDKLSEA